VSTERADTFEYPLRRGSASVGFNDEVSWRELERNLRRAATATTTTLLAALWPDKHFILDWRVLFALLGLQAIDPDLDKPTFTVRATGVATSMECYPWARAIMLNAASDTACSARDLERGLYKLSQRVALEKGRSWGCYGRALGVALAHAEIETDGDDGSEEA
jgi:hypothetical protein